MPSIRSATAFRWSVWRRWTGAWSIDSGGADGPGQPVEYGGGSERSERADAQTAGRGGGRCVTKEGGEDGETGCWSGVGLSAPHNIGYDKPHESQVDSCL